MLRIAVIDDDNLVCSQVEQSLIELSHKYGITSEIDIYYSGEGFEKCISNNEFYDVVFLDIEMKEVSGLEVSQKLRNTLGNEATQIIYISGKTEYAIEVFDYDPIHFLPKPLSEDLIEKGFVKLLHKLNVKAEAFAYKFGNHANKIPIKDILYFENDKRKIIIHFRDTTDCFYGSLEHIHRQLEKYHFIFIHKSFLINPLHVRKFTYESVEMSDHVILQIAQLKRKEVRKLLIDFSYEDGDAL